MGKIVETKSERMARYRSLVEDVQIPDDQKDEIILLVGHFMKNAINRALGKDPVQLVLERRENKNSHPDSDGANLPRMAEISRFKEDSNLRLET